MNGHKNGNVNVMMIHSVCCLCCLNDAEAETETETEADIDTSMLQWNCV
jgi:hypothetical protein